jgi:hypothetical protein
MRFKLNKEVYFKEDYWKNMNRITDEYFIAHPHEDKYYWDQKYDGEIINGNVILINNGKKSVWTKPSESIIDCKEEHNNEFNQKFASFLKEEK